MKKTLVVIPLLVVLSLACNLVAVGGKPSPSQSEGEAVTEGELKPTAPQSEKRCGDGVCGERENPQNCPQDCAAGAIPGGGEDQQDESPNEEIAAGPSAAGEPFLGMVVASAHLLRDVGYGDCGIEPWPGEGCSSSTYWWGLELQAAANTPVLVIPDGENRWVITNHADVVGKYGYDPADFQPSTFYQTASIDFGREVENSGCGGTISGEDGFDFQVMGTREGGQFELILSANPQEHTAGNCGVAGFEYETTNLLYGWAAALSGDPLDLTGVLTDADLTSEAGLYRREFTVDTNPSPENRDHVTAALEFWCARKVDEKTTRPTACPWEK